ncbi:MAG: hypothetical protein V1717_03555 [Candidatus Micrarchaeota archaeon]
MKKIFAMLILLAAAFTSAATIKGTVFDSDLEPVKAIVSLNTTPLQTMVAQNGSFSFQVPQGSFSLTAKAGNYSTAETLSIEKDGIFNIDLILFGFEDPTLEIPSVSEGTGFEGQETAVGEEPPSQLPWTAGIMVLAVAVALALVLYKWKGLKKEANEPKEERVEKKSDGGGLNEFQKQILSEIRKSEGRINQKELRKLLPWSEAKVSIELDLLEEKGIIKKIRKGRGNIIILVGK